MLAAINKNSALKVSIREKRHGSDNGPARRHCGGHPDHTDRPLARGRTDARTALRPHESADQRGRHPGADAGRGDRQEHQRPDQGDGLSVLAARQAAGTRRDGFDRHDRALAQHGGRHRLAARAVRRARHALSLSRLRPPDEGDGRRLAGDEEAQRRADQGGGRARALCLLLRNAPAHLEQADAAALRSRRPEDPCDPVPDLHGGGAGPWRDPDSGRLVGSADRARDRPGRRVRRTPSTSCSRASSTRPSRT